MRDCYYIKNDEENIVAMAFLSPDVNMGSENRWILNRIAVTRMAKTGEGWGTKLLELITAQADAEKATLWLGVDPDDPRMFYRLVGWYRRHGFKGTRISRVMNVMTREPQ